MPCMHHLLTSTEEADKFPLTCVGEEGRCGMPIPIPVVQRFLTPADFAHLLEVAFTSYVTKHPRSLKYCKTPDCTQIYRASKARPGTNCAIKCPSCFSSICSSCHEDDHEGMSCRDVRVAKNNERLSEAWVQRLKRCPRCQVPIEKSGGCNHISCRCGAHVCWKCMGVFNADVIYEHMNAVHGGIDDDQMMQNVPERVHYDEQERVLQQAREEHQRAAPRARVALLQAYEEIWRTAHRVERDRDLRVLQEDREAWEMEQPQQGMADARLEDRRRAQELRPRVQIFR
ncbi:Linear Ubiquitination-Associated E3 Ligase [Pleurotus pulmonarius]